MMNEATDFANHIKKMEKEIRNVKTTTESMLNSTKIVLSAPLPRVYEDNGSGKAQPVQAGPNPLMSTIGGDFKGEELARVSKDVSKKLEAEVLAPMQRWTTAYNQVVARMKTLEALRLEVDSRRRTVIELGRKIDKQHAKLPQTRSKGEIELETTKKTMQHKENKLNATRQSYKEHEVLLFQQLAQLIRDAVWLKSYVAAVMRVQQETFQMAYAAMGPMMAVGSNLAITGPGEVPAVPITPEHGVSTSSQDVDSDYGVPYGHGHNHDPHSSNPFVAPGTNPYLDVPDAPTHKILNQQQPYKPFNRYGDVYDPETAV